MLLTFEELSFLGDIESRSSITKIIRDIKKAGTGFQLLIRREPQSTYERMLILEADEVYTIKVTFSGEIELVAHKERYYSKEQILTTIKESAL